METCGNCKYWDTTGFGLREDYGSQKAAQVGRCQLVARHWYPDSPDKMIALMGTEFARWPGSRLIHVITRRKFGCNQFNKITETKEYKRLDPDEIAKALGAKHITDPKEKEEFKKRHFPKHKK